MYFDRDEFKQWLDPEENWFNPILPPKCIGDLIYLPLWFAVFGWLVLSLAFCCCLKFGPKP